MGDRGGGESCGWCGEGCSVDFVGVGAARVRIRGVGVVAVRCEPGEVVGVGSGLRVAGACCGSGLFDPPVAGVAGEGQRCGVVGHQAGGESGCGGCGEGCCVYGVGGCAARVRVRGVGVVAVRCEVGGVVCGGAAGFGGAGCAGGCGLFDRPVAGVAGEGQRRCVVGDRGGGERGFIICFCGFDCGGDVFVGGV